MATPDKSPFRVVIPLAAQATIAEPARQLVEYTNIIADDLYENKMHLHIQESLVNSVGTLAMMFSLVKQRATAGITAGNPMMTTISPNIVLNTDMMLMDMRMAMVRAQCDHHDVPYHVRYACRKGIILYIGGIDMWKDGITDQDIEEAWEAKLPEIAQDGKCGEHPLVIKTRNQVKMN